MRAIADVRDKNKIRILKICGSQYISIRDFGVFQVEREKARKVFTQMPERYNYKLAIVELNTTRNKGDIVDASELTIIHEENPVK